MDTHVLSKKQTVIEPYSLAGGTKTRTSKPANTVGAGDSSKIMGKSLYLFGLGLTYFNWVLKLTFSEIVKTVDFTSYLSLKTAD